MNSKSILLNGGDYHITESSDNAYRVVKGKMLVYIVPFQHDEIGRRSFVYEASEGEVIPGFSYRDIEYCYWKFCLVAVEKAELTLMEKASTKVLQNNFCKKCDIKNYEYEGFNNGLVDQYRANIVAEDSFIQRTQNNRENMNSKILDLLYHAFDFHKTVDRIDETKDPLYNALAYLCMKSHIEICSYEKMVEACGNSFDIADVARVSHFSYREVTLTSGWYKTDSGPFLVFDSHNKPLVCFPKGTESYVVYDVDTLSFTPVSNTIASSLKPTAYMLYRPLPSKRLTARDIASYLLKSVKTKDVILLMLLTVATAFIGLLTPRISQGVYDEYIPIGATGLLFEIGCVLFAILLSNLLFSIVKNLFIFRITSRMSYHFQDAVYGRLFHLPESFFRGYESADLAQRVMGSGVLVGNVANAIIISAIALIFIVIFFTNMLSYSVAFSMIGLLMVVVYGIVYYCVAVLSMKNKKRATYIRGKTEAVMYQILSGISKIRIAGAEERALFEYLKPYVQLRNEEERINRINGITISITLGINTLFSIVLYCVVMATDTGISFGSFIAFCTVFCSFSVYSIQLVTGIVSINQEQPDIERLKPVLYAIPEFDESKELPGEITGAIEINNVSFAYESGSPEVINNLNLVINAGEYIGIVGPSGCGKSTLLKLLLGFEKPVSGKIYYDNKDIENLDKRELRKKMGVVLQDGKLISGSIFENITVTTPDATISDVMEAVRSVGLEKDIDEMPMGLHTVLSEDCGTISGGQQQRIMIARAIISNPRILLFDEATSALDNLTQKEVINTIEKINATRIIIAHRLSTIMNCDRIIVLDKGKIIEQGNYQELMDQKGLFYQFAVRQVS